jgi:anaerobic selenocysteine-containing dehydrogenase
MIRRIRSIACALVLAGCAAPLTQGGAGAQDVSARRQVWAQQGMDDYRFVLTRECFCLGRGPMQVTVRDGRVAGVRDPQTGAEIPEQEAVGALTIEALFDRIAEAQANGEHTAIAYHPTLGYPTLAEIGSLAADAGIRYHVSDVARLE